MNDSRIDTLLDAFQLFVKKRIAAFFAGQPLLQNPDDTNIFETFTLDGRTLNSDETIILLCAFMPHIQPFFFDQLIREYLPSGGDFPEFGGLKGSNTRYMLPTGDTAMFLLAGTDIATRKNKLVYFSTAHFFWKESVLWLEAVKEGEPRFSGRLVLAADMVEKLLSGTFQPPAFGPDFPAKRLTTQQTFQDLVLPAATAAHLDDLNAWLHHQTTVMQDPVLSRKLKPGFRALFYGPSGTGKTLAATLLGKQFCKEVYRIDLSQVVSKFIGETEKNLEKIFAKAEHRDWILFFDEADALFGKRSNVQNAHDKYANQEVSYLLQRVEDFPGMVILASNFKSNIDNAFLRRFNAIIEFPMPGPGERYILWQKALPETIPHASDEDLQYVAEKYELSGSAIIQVVHYAALQMLHRNETSISRALLLEGIQKELRKEDKLFKEDSRRFIN